MTAPRKKSTVGDDARRGADDGFLPVCIGTYTGPNSRGIYLAQFNPATGQLTPPRLAAEAVNPSFLAIHPNRRFLYAVGELGDFAGTDGGAVSSYSISGDTGELALLNQVVSGGAGPCHLTVDRTGRWVLAANYNAGSVAVFPIQADGRLAEAATVVQHAGSSVDPARQAGPHAHSVNLDPDNRFAFVADLGIDRVFSYRFDPGQGTLAPNNPPSVSARPGAGPRHLAFHPTGRFVYVINELDNTVTAFRYDAPRGVLAELQTVSTIPDGYRQQSQTAEVVVHPSGRFLYGSNRGHDSIAVFAVAPEQGTLTPVGIQASRGHWPRGFTVAPGGDWLLAGNERSHTMVVFRINRDTGELIPAGDAVPVPAPVCIRFLPS